MTLGLRYNKQLEGNSSSGARQTTGCGGKLKDIPIIMGLYIYLVTGQKSAKILVYLRI